MACPGHPDHRRTVPSWSRSPGQARRWRTGRFRHPAVRPGSPYSTWCLPVSTRCGRAHCPLPMRHCRSRVSLRSTQATAITD